MFCTTPWRWIPASAKLGRGAGRGGSTHCSNMVLGFCESSADVLLPSAGGFEVPGMNGLAIRDLVGLGVGVDIVAAEASTSLSLRPRVLQPGATKSGEALVQGQAIGEQRARLLDSKDTCTPDAMAIRGGGRVGELVRKWRWGASEEGEKAKVSLRASLTDPLRERDLPPRKTPGEGRAHRGEISV